MPYSGAAASRTWSPVSILWSRRAAAGITMQGLKGTERRPSGAAIITMAPGRELPPACPRVASRERGRYPGSRSSRRRPRVRRRRALWCHGIAGGGRTEAAEGAARPRLGTAEVPGQRRYLAQLSACFRPVKQCLVLARSWFGLQVGLGFAGAAGPGFQELGQGRGMGGLPAAELIDHDQVGGTAGRPLLLGLRQVVGLAHFGRILLACPWVDG